MDINKLKSRDSSLDIVRIVAVFSVVSVHFFLHNGFYSEIVQGEKMYIACIMRTLFSICVPMFMLLTGYLMSNKSLSKKYYKGITKTLVVFVLATIACMLFNNFAQFGEKLTYNGEQIEFGLKSFILKTLDFSGANYSWYIEMYIGLFLIAPFLNLAYNGLKTKKQKQILVATFVFIAIIPSLFNVYDFTSQQWWAQPSASDKFVKIIPAWWTGIYPIAYYFTGCYLREYKLKIKPLTLGIITVIAIILFGTFNYYRSYGVSFKTGSYIYWNGIQSYIMTVCIFILITKIKTEKIPVKAKVALWKISDLALGVYLLSYIFDKIVYHYLNNAIQLMPDKLIWYFVTVPIVFICSVIASGIINFIAHYLIIGVKLGYSYLKNKILEIKNHPKIHIYLFGILMIGAFAFSIWKCFFGFGGNDEAFYLTVPHRLTLGDALFTDEWNLSQLSGVLLLPFVWLYKTIMQSTDGIMLAARFLYVVFHAGITVAIYSRLKKFGYLAVFGCVLYFIFTPFNIMAMSYNTMALDFIALTGALMGTTSYKKKAPLIISGVSLAAAVLCCPYLVIAYVMYAIAVVVHILIKKIEYTKKFNKNLFNLELFNPKTFLWFSVGIFSLAFVFMLFLLSRTSISSIISNLPNLLNDPAHPQTGVFEKFNKYITSIINCQTHFKFIILSYIIMLAVMIVDKKRKVHRSVYLIITSALVIISLILFFPTMTTTTYNHIMYPMIMIGITSYVLIENKPRKLMASLFSLGIIYSFALCMASNQYFYVISMAAAASNLASYVFLYILLKEMRKSKDNLDYEVICKYASLSLVVFMLFLQASFQIGVKANHSFWDSTTNALNYQITSGPAKGLITNKDNCQTYENIYNDLNNNYSKKERNNILCLTDKTWTYLALNDYPYATFSAWLTGENNASVSRLQTYYISNPKKRPKYIYIPKSSNWDFTNIHIQANALGYELTENNVSYNLVKKD